MAMCVRSLASPILPAASIMVQKLIDRLDSHVFYTAACSRRQPAELVPRSRPASPPASTYPNAVLLISSPVLMSPPGTMRAYAWTKHVAVVLSS